MLLPTVQYGTSADVKRRMASIVKRIVGGESLTAVMTEQGLTDVADTAGQLLVGGASRSRGTHFHTWMPWLPLSEVLAKRGGSDEFIEDTVFTESLTTAWGVLGMSQYNCQWWVLPPRRHRPFLDAAVKFWSELDAVGARYCSSDEPSRLWDEAGTLHYVLAQLGVSSERLRSPLPPGGLGALLKYARGAN